MTDNTIETVARLTADLRKAAATLSDAEARFLVDAYYMMQEDRKRSDNQILSLDKNEPREPHELLDWFAAQNKMLEGQIKGALGRYAESKPAGRWMQGVYGIGPVISAGLLAHIDINKAPTVGHIWRFAGLDPTVEWHKGEKRPWNASLKTLCWKIGQSFMKFSGQEECYYGKIYIQRKQYETARNDRGDNAEKAATALVKKKYSKDTEAYKQLSVGKLPLAQIDARARRYAVKLFLSHLQGVWWEMETGTPAPKPYPIAILGHAHEIKPE